MGFSSYDIARTGMSVSERGLNVTGHNISNISTPGYTKQQIIISNLHYVDYAGGGQKGFGADVSELRQLRNDFLDLNFRNENSSLGYWETKQKNLEQIQTMLDEPFGNGLQHTMDQFWSGWQELIKNPNDITNRALLKQRTNTMVNSFNHLGEQLTKLQSDINKDIISRVDDINSYAEQIKELSLKINANEVSGDKANDYRDQRNSLLDKLSKIIKIDVQETQDNYLNVTIGGQTLVSKTISQKLITKENVSGSTLLYPAWQVNDTLVDVNGGELKGFLEVRGEFARAQIGSPSNGSPDGVINIDENQTIPSLREKLNEVINKLTTEVNKIHKQGYGIDEPASTGLDFFTTIDSTKPMEMENIQINPALLDLNKIAASSNKIKGDGSNAQKIIELKDVKFLGEDTDKLTFNEFYRDVIMRIGVKGQEANTMSENQNKLVTEIQNKKETISGVNIDEEMESMLRYQRAYQASARVLNVMDEMMLGVIEKLGR